MVSKSTSCRPLLEIVGARRSYLPRAVANEMESCLMFSFSLDGDRCDCPHLATSFDLQCRKKEEKTEV